MIQDIAQLILFGVISGSIFALSGIGLSLTYGILRFANFAHGDTMTVGAFAALSGLAMLQGAGLQAQSLGPLSFGWPMLASLGFGMAVAAGMAVLTDRLLYSRFRRSGAAILLISSVGVAFGLRALLQFFYSPQPQYYIRKIQVGREFLGLRIKPDQIFIIAVTGLLVLLLHLFLTRTRLGKAMRATADNMDLAKVSGIDTERVVLWTWIIGGALAGAGGVLAGIENKFITPNLGWNMLLFIFASVILGGIGSPYGALVGGLIIGISGELSTLFIDPVYKQSTAFLIMIVMLLVRPSGLFGER